MSRNEYEDNLSYYRSIVHAKEAEMVLPLIEDAMLAGDYKKVDAFVATMIDSKNNDGIRAVLDRFYDDMPEDVRRGILIDWYADGGDSDPYCVGRVRALPRRGPEELPEKYRDMDEITVYRAGEESIDECGERLSWTLDEGKARWFLDIYPRAHANYLYRAKIRPADVIAYTDGRNEKEVIQFMSVYDAELVDTLGSGGTNRYIDETRRKMAEELKKNDTGKVVWSYGQKWSHNQEGQAWAK